MRFNTHAQVLTLACLFLPLSGCLSTGGGTTTTEQNSVMISEVVSICGALVGDQAQQRINQEWSKYPQAEANRPLIEAVAETLLNDPNASEQQRTRQYRKYITCATGLLMSNGLVK